MPANAPAQLRENTGPAATEGSHLDCPLCHKPVTWQHGWPACCCDCDPQAMLTVAQAAKFMCCTYSRIYHLIEDGYLRADKTQRPIRIAMVILKAYLAGGHAYTHQDMAALGRAAANTRTSDPVLTAIKEARNRRDHADQDIRVLLAYARELTRPRPYRLADLAAAAGMSVSGVRTAYTQEDTETARRLLAVSDGHTHDRDYGGWQEELPA